MMTKNDLEGQVDVEEDAKEVEVVDYTKRAQWLRPIIVGANDGLLSTASLMMGAGAVRKDMKTMILTGIAGLIAGACSMAIGEFVFVYSQYDIENSQMKRQMKAGGVRNAELEARRKHLPNPFKEAMASAFALAMGALVPLLAAGFVRPYLVRIGVVVGAVSLGLLVFGGVIAVLGGTPLVKSSLRVLIGGWVRIGIIFVMTKFIGLLEL